MKIVSFNTNGIRARPHQLEALKTQYMPDVIGIQETKVQDDAFPLEAIQALGYTASYHGQKGHYGVALLSTEPPEEIIKGMPEDDKDAQRRLITGRYRIGSAAPVIVMNGYFPQGESRDHPVKFPAKRKFYQDLLDYLRRHYSPEQPLLLMGDMNVAPEDTDIGIGADNAKRWLNTGKCSFLPEERDWFRELQKWGLQDCYRHCHPDRADQFSWFDYRSRGFERDPKRGLRIDMIMATKPLLEKCRDAGIAYDIRSMERPSDHCPVWADFDV